MRSLIGAGLTLTILAWAWNGNVPGLVAVLMILCVWVVYENVDAMRR